jgi:hypothetical protein
MVVNRSADTLRDCTIGQASDPDLGLPTNDHVEFYAARPDLCAARAWTDREVQDTWGQLVMVLLEGPVVDANGFVDNSRRSEFEASGRVGSFPEWTPDNDPVTDAGRYDFMTSGQFATDDSAGDKRAMMATSKFNMLPGDTVHFVVAYGVMHGRFGRAHDKGIVLWKLSSDADDIALEEFSAAIRYDYYHGYFTGSTSSVPMENRSGALSLALAPNPVTDNTTIAFSLPRPAQTAIQVFDMLGRRVADYDLGTREAGDVQATLNCGRFEPGSYTVVVVSDDVRDAVRMVIVR